MLQALVRQHPTAAQRWRQRCLRMLYGQRQQHQALLGQTDGGTAPGGAVDALLGDLIEPATDAGVCRLDIQRELSFSRSKGPQSSPRGVIFTSALTRTVG